MLIAALGLITPASIAAESDVKDLTASVPSAECKVTCVDPHTNCKESEKVLEVLETLVKAINNGDWKTYGDNLDEHCTTFDESNHKLISGRESVVLDMKSRVEKYEHQGAPFVSVCIDQPYAQVTGDTAVVTFVAIRQYGGKHPFKEEAHATDVFLRQGDSWKKCHFRGAWKRV